MYNSNFHILQRMTLKIKNYFLNRENALRCIINLWIKEIKADDTEVSNKSHLNVYNVPFDGENESQIDDVSNQSLNFMIHKSKIANEKYRYKKSNIKTLLIDLYGSKEIFL